MQLKRWDAIDWLELPRIEHPTHARYVLERLINVNGIGVCRVDGLKDVLWSDTQWNRNGILDRHSHDMLMRRVEQGEVFLIQDVGLEPNFPLLRPNTGDKSTHWQIIDDTLDHFMRDRVDWMLSNAAGNKGIQGTSE